MSSVHGGVVALPCPLHATHCSQYVPLHDTHWHSALCKFHVIFELGCPTKHICAPNLMVLGSLLPNFMPFSFPPRPHYLLIPYFTVVLRAGGGGGGKVHAMSSKGTWA